MKPIGDIQRPRKVASSARNGRDAVIDDFLNALNPSRIESGFAAYTADRLLGKIAAAGYETTEQELYALYNQCAKAEHFGKLFSYLTQPSNKARNANRGRR